MEIAPDLSLRSKKEAASGTRGAIVFRTDDAILSVRLHSSGLGEEAGRCHALGHRGGRFRCFERQKIVDAGLGHLDGQIEAVEQRP